MTSTLTEERPAILFDNLAVDFGSHHAVRNVSFPVQANRVTAIVGPSGCGKTTVLRAVNRMHDRAGGAVSGSIRVGDTDVYGPEARPEAVRRQVGMVFQRPNPFPTMSIFNNVVSGLRFRGVRRRDVLRDAAERALRSAALWTDVRDRLRDAALGLSGGQQQRLCIARALAVQPAVLLMDEPCSALDPVSTAAIEDLIRELAHDVTVALVTHDMFEAARCSDFTAVLLPDAERVGELAEYGPTARVFGEPTDPRTEAYVTGRVG